MVPAVEKLVVVPHQAVDSRPHPPGGADEQTVLVVRHGPPASVATLQVSQAVLVESEGQVVLHGVAVVVSVGLGQIWVSGRYSGSDRGM